MSGENNNLLVAENVRKEFGGLVATNDVDFTIPRESVISLIGPNGAGKTTFFNMLTGVYKPTAGTIVFDGASVPPGNRRRLMGGVRVEYSAPGHSAAPGQATPQSVAPPPA